MNDVHERPPHLAAENRALREPHRDETSLRSIFWGVTLIALGLFFTVDQLDIFETTDLLREWWPLLLIAFGIYNRGFVVTGIGIWLLISGHGWFGLTYSTSWPVILIVAGLGIVLQAIFGEPHRRDCHRRRLSEDGR